MTRARPGPRIFEDSPSLSGGLRPPDPLAPGGSLAALAPGSTCRIRRATSKREPNSELDHPVRVGTNPADGAERRVRLDACREVEGRGRVHALILRGVERVVQLGPDLDVA